MLSQNSLVNHRGESDGRNSSLKTPQPKQNTHWSNKTGQEPLVITVLIA